MLFWRTLWISGILSVILTNTDTFAAPPLHQRIDELIESRSGFAAAEIVADDEFLRRVTLDLTGTIPAADDVRAFLADADPDKRTKLIDRLLNSPAYARRMSYVFDVMLMERRPDKHVTAPEWEGYLRQSFLENKPWDQLVAETLTADGADEATRPAAKFLLDRDLSVDDATRDLGRIFLGRDMQCAQCHDHPNVDDYLQRHYFGLAAFIKRSYLFKDPKSGKTSIGEKAEGTVEFTSVFTGTSGKTPPRMLDMPALEDPTVGDDPYQVKPEKTARGVPVYSRRLQLAKAMTDDANVPFCENIANRLWALMMGRGIVEPVDMSHYDNPPSHPEVLSLIADALMSRDYDIRYLLRELALTKAYQRSSRSSAESGSDTVDYSVALLKPLTPEQLAWSMMQAVGVVDQKRQALEKSKKDAELMQAVDEAMRSEIKAFVDVFGITGVQVSTYDAAADQALFLRNGSLIQGWLASDGGLVSRLSALDNQQAAEEFYLTVFSRQPEESETAQFVEFLENHPDRTAAFQRLVWAALVSAEFRFNH